MTTTDHFFGFCITGGKNLDKHNCPGKFRRFVSGKVVKSGKKVDGITFLDEYVKCTCLCHIPEADRPKTAPKKRRRKAKK